MADKIKILGIPGSLRKGSYNRWTLNAAQQLVPAEATLEVFDTIDFPGFNEDIERDPPQGVVEFKERIRSADAILFVSPEYNYSIPGVLKNAIDWASRPYGDSAWAEKPVAVMSASIGAYGGVRMQHHLRQCFVFLNMHPLQQPEVIIGTAQKKFDSEGKLTDETTKKFIRQQLEALVAWTRRLRADSLSSESLAAD